MFLERLSLSFICSRENYHYCKGLYKHLLTHCNSSDIEPTNKEVESGTDATISCVISGITQQLDTVVWRKDGTDVTTTTTGGNYFVSPGTYGSNSQITTLSVKAAANTADSTYTCAITSNEWLVTNQQTNVILNVFGKCFRSLL